MNRAPDHRKIYAEHAEEYELLVSREDFQSNIAHQLAEIEDFGGRDVVELGAGTGRLTRMLAPRAESIRAFDVSRNMLAVAAARLRGTEYGNWALGVADHRQLPLASGTADIVISGWSMAYLVLWNRHAWKAELLKGMSEAERVLRPGGTFILLESLGTGEAIPQPPANLSDYYALLDQEGFASTWFRTDYQFETFKEAEDVIRLFFGEEMVGKTTDEGSITLPECTGLWWKRYPS